MNLGEIPFERLSAVMAGDQPKGLTDAGRQSWEFLWNVRATVEGSGDQARRRLSKSDAARVVESGLNRGVQALVGHTYLLRPVLYESHDHLVVFTVIQGDESGHTLAWRILKTWQVDAVRIERR